MLCVLEAGDDGLPSSSKRWKKLLTDRSPTIRLAAEKFLFEALHGKSRPWEEPPAGPIKITVDVSKEPNDPDACKVEIGEETGE